MAPSLGIAFASCLLGIYLTSRASIPQTVQDVKLPGGAADAKIIS
jgi:hypothetical protein